MTMLVLVLYLLCLWGQLGIVARQALTGEDEIFAGGRLPKGRAPAQTDTTSPHRAQ